MQKLYFITGNQHKFKEVKKMLPYVEHLDTDLPEIQDLDPQKIIKEKLLEAKKHHRGMFIVEDTGLYVKSMNGFPGPLVKWVLKTVDRKGLAKIANTFGNGEATAKTVIGLIDENDDVFYFEGTVEGKIVEPRGDSKFGWDPIFIPNGYNETFAELGSRVKNKISMRKNAVEKLKDYLDSKN